MEPILWPILLLLAAFGLLVLEVFIPSGGLLSILAIVCLVSAVVAGFLVSLPCGVTVLGITVFGVPALLAAAVKYWPHTPIGRLILNQPPADPSHVLPESDRLEQLIGRRGFTQSKMLPGGVVTVGQRNYDALSEGMPIDERQPIQVVAVRIHRLVVRPAQGPPDDDAVASDDVLSQPLDSLGLEDFES